MAAVLLRYVGITRTSNQNKMAYRVSILIMAQHIYKHIAFRGPSLRLSRRTGVGTETAI